MHNYKHRPWFSPEKQACTCAVSYRTSRDYTGSVLRYGEGAAGKVAASGQAQLIDDYRTWEDRAKSFDLEQSFHALLAVPMLWDGQVTGMIDVLREQPFYRMIPARLSACLKQNCQGLQIKEI